MVPIGLSSIDLPMKLVIDLGCRNCDWRGTSLCEYGIKKRIDKHKDLVNGICEKRKYLILSCYTGTQVKPSYKSLLRDYRHWIMNEEVIELRRKLNQIDDHIEHKESQLSDVGTGGDISLEDDIKQLCIQRNFIHDRFMEGSDKLNRSDDRDKDRESRDKNIDKLQLGLGDIHRIMNNGNVVDADYEETK